MLVYQTKAEATEVALSLVVYQEIFNGGGNKSLMNYSGYL